MGRLNTSFGEEFAVVDTGLFSGVTTEQNTGYVSIADYLRIAIVIHALVVGTTLDVDIEIGTSSGGADAVTLKSITQLGASADGAVVVIDVRPDELSNPAGTAVNEFSFLNVEVTPSGSATVSVLVLGQPRYRDEEAAGWTEVVS